MMPLSDGNPFALARLAPGITYNGDLKFSRPFDNGGTSGIVTGGAPGGNEFSLDGSPNMANGRRVAFVPPAGAVQEFKVETASFDAASGHTGGRDRQRHAQERHEQPQGIRLHLLPVGQARRDRFLREEGERRKPELGYNRPGFTFGGPVYSRLRRPRQDVLLRRGGVALRQVPRAALPDRADRRRCATATSRRCWRRASSIYDPLSAATRSAPRVVRQPFAGNIIPAEPAQSDRAEGAELLPAAEPAGATPADATTSSTRIRAPTTSTPCRCASITRSTSKQRLMARYTRNDRRESRNAIYGEVNGIVPTGNFLFRKNDGVTVDHTWTQSANSLWDFRGGWQQFREPNVRQHEGMFDPASLGFSPAVVGAVRRRAATSRSSTSTRSATSATTWPATPRTPSTRSSRPTRSWPATTRCAPATTCASTTSSARTPAGRRATT